MNKMSRRRALQLLAATGAAATRLPRALGQGTSGRAAGLPARGLPPAPAVIAVPEGFGIAKGPFEASIESLSSHEVPEWYRDLKFGIWAHWGPQCQPEQGDWYAQQMYVASNARYRFHVKNYGHPSTFGFKDVCNQWKAEKWDPVKLMGMYKKAGAKFFAAMANHHDNMDMFDSTYQPWNSVKVGPKKDLVGGWAKAAREAGLRLAITSHAGRAWNWYNVARDADTSGPLAGVPYDGTLTREDGKGLWWEGLDPQDLYAQYSPRNATRPDKAYSEKYLCRIVDLINKYDPDILYFDDAVFPLYPITDVGPRIAAYLYNKRTERHGKPDVVMTGKGLNATQRKAILLDLERAVGGGADPIPWQTDTCIGDWHYRRSLFEHHGYKTPEQVITMLIDIVSKNGTLMLSIPLPGSGLPDEDELQLLDALAKWISINGEGIYDTRPWAVYGEGPSTRVAARGGTGADTHDYTAEDVRFTQKGGTVYAFLMGWPANGRVVIRNLAAGSPNFPGAVGQVELLGSGQVKFTRDGDGLAITMPAEPPCDFACTVKVTQA